MQSQQARENPCLFLPDYPVFGSSGVDNRYSPTVMTSMSCPLNCPPAPGTKFLNLETVYRQHYCSCKSLIWSIFTL